VSNSSKLDALKRRWKVNRPRVGTAFLTYVDLRGRKPDDELASQYQFHVIDSADDPMLVRFSPRWQREWARPGFADGTVYAMYATDGDTIAAHCWVATDDISGLINGMPSFPLCEDEVYCWDLYLEPEYRRSNMGTFIGLSLMKEFDDRGYDWAYTMVDFGNVPSIFWHAGMGFNWVQIFKFVTVAQRVFLKIPSSPVPSFGPLSRHGRHSAESPDEPFGGSLLPAPYDGP
jgi:GNAT superfamily N-acetyltransferase